MRSGNGPAVKGLSGRRSMGVPLLKPGGTPEKKWVSNLEIPKGVNMPDNDKFDEQHPDTSSDLQKNQTNPPVDSLFKKGVEYLSIGTGIICGIATIVLMAIVNYEVFARYVFNSPTEWVLEYSVYIFVCASFMGAGYAMFKDAHIRVELFLCRASPTNQKMLKRIASWMGLFLVIIAAWQMIKYTHTEFITGSRNWDMKTTLYWIPQSFVCAGLVLFALSILAEARGFAISLNWIKKLVVYTLMAGTVPFIYFFGTHATADVFIWGILYVMFAVCVSAFLWHGVKTAAISLILIMGVGGVFYLIRDWSYLAQGSAMAIAMLILMAMGVRIAVSLGIVGLMSAIFLLPMPQLIILAERSWTQIHTHSFTAVPMFLLMGLVLLRSGISGDLFSTMVRWLGRLPGGIGHATIGACAIFAAVTGSSLATAATMGMTACPEMSKHGYSPRLSYGVVAAGGTLGILIPPSIAMILYGSLADVRIDLLFIAGIVPGVLLVLSFMAVIALWSLFKPEVAPKSKRFTWSERFVSLGGMLPFMLLIIGVIGSLYAGVCSPTEAGALGTLVAIILAVFRKKLTWKILVESAMETASITSFIIIIIAFSSIVVYSFDYLRLPMELVELINNANLSTGMVMVVLVIFYMVLGMFIDPVSIMIMTWSVALPIVVSLGFDPIWFGVILTMMIEIGLITPPVGLILFVLKGIAGDEVPLREIVIGVIPFLGVFLLCIAIFYFFPGLVMWLPNLLAVS